MRVQVCILVYMRVCVFLLMDCLSEATRSASYGWLKHLLTSHVRWVWSYLWEALSKCVNPSHPDHFVWGQRFGLCDSLFPHTTSQGVAEAITASISCAIVMSEVVPLLWQGDQCFRPLPRPPNSFDLDAFHRCLTALCTQVIVICQLWWSHHAYRKSGTALAHCLTFTSHTQTHTHFHLLSAAVYHLSFPLFTFSGEGEQTWPACFVIITITSMCHLFSWVFQYLSQSRYSQKLSWNTSSMSSQLVGQKYSLWPH